MRFNILFIGLCVLSVAQPDDTAIKAVIKIALRSERVGSKYSLDILRELPHPTGAIPSDPDTAWTKLVKHGLLDMYISNIVEDIRRVLHGHRGRTKFANLFRPIGRDLSFEELFVRGWLETGWWKFEKIPSMVDEFLEHDLQILFRLSDPELQYQLLFNFRLIDSILPGIVNRFSHMCNSPQKPLKIACTYPEVTDFIEVIRANPISENHPPGNHQGLYDTFLNGISEYGKLQMEHDGMIF